MCRERKRREGEVPVSSVPLSFISSSKSCINSLVGSLWGEWLKDQASRKVRIEEDAVQELTLPTEPMQ